MKEVGQNLNFFSSSPTLSPFFQIFLFTGVFGTWVAEFTYPILHLANRVFLAFAIPGLRRD